MGLFRRKSAPRAPLPVQAAARTSGSLLRRTYRRLPNKVRFLIAAPVTACLAGLAVLAGMMVYYTVAFPDPLSLRHKEKAQSVRILARDGSLIGQRGGHQDFIPLDLIPKIVIGAVVATEDRRFNEHWGLDPIGLLRASFANLRAGRFAQGGSTLTQQLAKNLFLTPERTMARKLEELVLAFWLEMRLSKNEILELYLNRVYFGGGAYGIEAASQKFYDKSARELSIGEAAVVAGLLKAPSKFSPTANPGAARARGRTVLTKMLETGVITPEQERQARSEVVQFATGRQSKEPAGADYLVDMVNERLPALIGPSTDDLIVETTVEWDLQTRASEIVRRELVLQGSVLAADQAAVVVLDTDGGIRALIGGRSYAESQFNRAVKARRQPGSSFKPFVYLAALEAGFTPDSVAQDLPVNVKGWAPRNDNDRYTGAVTLRHALAQSINSVAARLILEVGPHRVGDVARRLGVASPLREEASLALGTSEVSLLELTGAYAPLANGGRRIETHIIRRVRSGAGRILYARTAPQHEMAVSVGHVAAMNEMLSEAVRTGTGKRAALAAHPAAGKTGTSQAYRDAWFVGYTAHLVGGVWVGNDNGSLMQKVRGGQLPAEIWRQIMQSAHARRTPTPLPGLAEYGLNSAKPNGPIAIMPPVATGSTGSAPEILPWLNTPAESVKPPIVPPARAYPKSPIDADLIARALADGAAAQPANSASPAPRPTSAGDVQGNKIIVRPPPGLMSLGAGLPVAEENVQLGSDLEEAETVGRECGLWAYVTGC